MNDLSNEVMELANRMKPMLAGRAPEVQSAVIAKLLSTWVLGFKIPGDLEVTKNAQAKFLANHVKLVMDLIACQASDVYQEVLRRN